MVDEGAQHDRVDAVLGDTLGIAKMFIGTVINTDATLQPGTGRADLARGPVQGAADAIVRFELQHLGAAFSCLDGERKTGGAGTDHNHVPVFHGTRLPQTPLS